VQGHPHSGHFGIAEDVTEQVQNIENSGDWRSKSCINVILSNPTSYAYMPYAVRTLSQLVEASFAVVNGFTFEPEWTQYAGEWPNLMVFVPPSTINDFNCPSGWNTAEMPNWQRARGLGDFNASANPASIQNSGALHRDDDGSQLPSSYSHLKEGIWRFFITDINNPASGAMAQSSLPVMWDAWSNSINWHGDQGGIARFNHVPGGSNVLYMDGHVQFVKYNAEFPIATMPLSEAQPVQAAAGRLAYQNIWAGMG
jgi:prepilin-type processing-associated H-X9-DG protein